MYIDNFLKLSDGQAVTASAFGTNVIDLSENRSIGGGEPMVLAFAVIVAADQTTGDEDYTFFLETASDAAQTTARQLIGARIFESGTPVGSSQDADLLVAGFKFYIPIPPATLAETNRFLGVRYQTAGTSPTITMDCWVGPLSMVDADVIYADNVPIS